MVDKLRWKLTVFNTAITGAILLAMTLMCLMISEQNTRTQTYQNFLDEHNTIASYLEVQSQISATWLRQMDADPVTSISILDAGMPLFSLGLSTENRAMENLFRQAMDHAKAELRSGHCSFSMDAKNGCSYFAVISLIPKKNTAMELITLYSLSGMENSILRQRLMVSLAAMVAILILGVFSWFFTGRMLRPILENQRRQTEFIASASHELRTPLAAILSAASAMERADPVQRAQFSDMIHREGNRMSRLVGDMLTLASSDSKQWQLQKKEVELDMLLLEVYESQYPQVKEKGQSLTLSLYEQEIPPLLLNRDAITQVLTILLDNARHYTPVSGKIELELTRHRNKIQIRVSDTGPGVPDSEKQKIFQRFYRGETSRSSRGHFGLGLCIAAEIIKQHQGKIWVQDTISGGAEFVVELPIL